MQARQRRVAMTVQGRAQRRRAQRALQNVDALLEQRLRTMLGGEGQAVGLHAQAAGPVDGFGITFQRVGQYRLASMLTREKPMITTNATSVLNTIEWRVESWSRSDWGMVGSSGGDDAFCALRHSLAMVRVYSHAFGLCPCHNRLFEGFLTY